MDTSKLAVNNFALDQRGRKPVTWQTLTTEINHLDLGAARHSWANVTLQGLKIDARALRNGTIDLTDSDEIPRRNTAPANRLHPRPGTGASRILVSMAARSH